MMTAKDEIGDFTTATRFGGRKRIKRDKKISRPINVVETIAQIRQCYAENKWDSDEQRQNHASLGLGEKTLADLTDDELEVVRLDMEKRGMILYED